MGLGTADQGKHIHQIIELLAAGNGQLAVTSYHEIVDQISDQTQYWFESLFGLYALSSDDDVLFEQSLSTRFIEDSVIAKQALEFYCQNQNPHAVQQLLRKLSYDSPYSDFRRIISTLLDIVNAPRGLDRLDGIDALSPYRRIAGLIQLAAGYSTGMLVLAEFSPVEQQFIQALICQTKAALQPLCLPSFTPQQLFEFLLNNAEVFEEEILQKLLTNLVVDYPAGLDAYRQHDDQLSEFECFRLQALASERTGHWKNAASLWSQCIQTLDQINIEDYEVARQLISQRIQYCQDQYGYDNPRQQTAALKQYFKLNPDDPDACLQLLAQYRTFGEDEALRQLLKQAVLQFPQHPDIVAAAVENANETVEFEQATQIARALLDDDALNQDARRLLIQAYLSYADKLSLRGQYYAAEILFDQTEALERPASSGKVCLHRALMHHIVGDESKAESLVEQGCTQLGGYLIGYLIMAAETTRLGFKEKYRKHYLKLIQSLVGYRPDSKEMVSVIQLLSDYINDSRTDSTELINAIRPFLQRSLNADLDTGQLLFICEVLEQLNLYADLYQVALEACQHAHHQDDIFDYYRIIGSTQGNPAQINSEDSQLLEQMLDHLTDINPQLIVKITSYLNANLNSGINTLEMSAEHNFSTSLKHQPDINVGEVFSTIKRLFQK